MVEHLSRLARSFCRLGGAPGSGSAKTKFVADRLAGLKHEVAAAAVVPYSRPRVREVGSLPASMQPTQPLPLVAERVALPAALSGFHPEPFLAGRSARAYACPGHELQRDQGMQLRRGWGSSGEELIKLLRRWDALGRLVLARPEDVSREDTSEVFVVAKSETQDRQLLDRRPRNAVEGKIFTGSQWLPHASCLADLHLAPDEEARGYLDDFSNMYHEFQVSGE